jgi:hypothetical protein
VYFNLPNVDPWDIRRDARSYDGVHRVVAHPPCERWGRYWSGGPKQSNPRRQKGDDGGCFASALASVRRCGGVLEHPEASHAWAHFGLARPPRSGGWVKADAFGGFTCCVAQGHYGHRAQKLTWLYAVGLEKLPELTWGVCTGLARLDPGFHSADERAKARARGISSPVRRLTKRENVATPLAFRDLLISIAEGVGA